MFAGNLLRNYGVQEIRAETCHLRHYRRVEYALISKSYSRELYQPVEFANFILELRIFAL